jgi:Protein of unknown function (DUF3592)
MLPFIVIFFLAGITLVSFGHKAQREAKRSASWPVVNGELELCEVVKRPGIQVSDTSTWQLQIRYSYVVKGTTYHSTRYAYGYGNGSNDDQEYRVVANALRRLPKLAVHYDPATPNEAVICTEPQTNLTVLGYASLGMAVISTLIWLVMP